MAEFSKIEWTDHTFNPWIGCTKVSPACDHCYAEAMMDHRYGRVRWGVGEARSRTSHGNWQQPRRWNREAEKNGTRPKVFCSSLADVFDNEVDPAWRADLFALIAETPNLIWLLLTKRIGNAVKMVKRLPANAALGATMAFQEEWDRDANRLEEAAGRLGALFSFSSVEPMIGPVAVNGYCPDWVICGGESGSGFRDMPEAWARSLRDQTLARGKAFFMKQMAGKRQIPSDLLIRQFPLPLSSPPEKGW